MGRESYVRVMPLTPVNTFAGNPLDRAGDRRDDPALLARQAGPPQAPRVLVGGGRPPAKFL